MKLITTIVVLLTYGIINCDGVTTHRNDVRATLKSVNGEGPWGTWSQPTYCNAGNFAVGFWLKVEGSQGGGDDTAANGFALHCTDGGANVHAGNDGAWGDWGSYRSCGSSYLVGFQTKVEASQGGGDDTALNSVNIRCSSGTNLQPTNGGPWGDWGGWGNCPARTSVCGFRQKVESSQGGGDDTAMNGLELYCCTNKKAFSNPVGRWNLVIAGGGGGTISHSIKYGVTNHESWETTSEFGVSVTATASADFKFVSASLSVTASAKVAETTVKGYSTTTETTKTITCEPGDTAMYQWITSMTENAMTETFSFEIKSPIFWCVADDSHTPQCPYGYCKDHDCQTCDDYGQNQVALTWAAQQDVGNYALFESSSTQWFECPNGYVLAGFWKNDCQKVHCIENMKCVAPKTNPVVSQSCYVLNMWSAFDNGGTVECNDGHFVRGIKGHANSGHTCGIQCWEELRCCQYDTNQLTAESSSSSQNWWSCFDGTRKGWCLVDNNEYITGFYRSSGSGHELYLLEEAKVRKIYGSSSSAKVVPLSYDQISYPENDYNNEDYIYHKQDPNGDDLVEIPITTTTIVFGLIILLGVISVIAFSIHAINRMCGKSNGRNKYRVVKYDTDTDVQQDDENQLL